MQKSLLALSLISVASPSQAFLWGSNSPVQEALNDGHFELSLSQYKEGKATERKQLITAHSEQKGIPAADVDHYVNCMGDFAANKSPELKFADVFGWCELEAKNNRERFEGHFNELDAEDLSSEALIMCQNFVKTQLKAPATAEFPWGANKASRGEWRYQIASYVDAQNTYGAQVRTHFNCDMQYHGPTEADAYWDYRNWTMHDFSAY